MQFKLDEKLPPSAAELLRGLGHDVTTVYDQGLQSCTDPEVLAACQGEGRILLSLDLDFSNILVYPPERYAGLIVLRLHKPGPRAVMSLLRRVVPHLETVPVAGRLWIADQHRIRIRLVGEIDLGPEAGEVPIP
jgi:predicted nuclease of predicted toxin-antitoxin system